MRSLAIALQLVELSHQAKEKLEFGVGVSQFQHQF